MIRRRIAAVVAATGLALTTGCVNSGNGDSGGEDTFTKKGDAKVQAQGETLDVWIMEGTNEGAPEFFAQVGKDFKAETGAEINVQYVPWEDALTKLNNVAGSDAAPDVVELGTTYTPQFAEAGALLPLDQQVADAGLDSDLVDSLKTAGTIDGKLYGFPWYAGTRAFIYNKDMFAKAGIQPPKTWADLQAACGKLKQANPGLEAPLPIAGGSEYPLYPFIWGAGGDVAQESGGKWTSTLDDAKTVEGIQFYTDLATKHGCSTDAATTWDEGDTLTSFENEKSAMIINGSWIPSVIQADKPDLNIGAFAIPGKNGGMSESFVGGSHLAIFSNTQNPDLAWAFVRMLGTGTYAEMWASQTHFFPGTTSLLDKAAQSNDPLVAPFAQQMVDAGRSVPVTPLWTEVQGKTIMPAMLQSILEGTSVPDAAKKATDEMDAVFSSGG